VISFHAAEYASLLRPTSFHVVLVEDCCAAGTDALHEQELAILNRIYCHVVTSPELCDMMGLG
jgi:nicotinamidase-related amidase